MALTDLQKSRIRFHLGYMGMSPLTSILEVQEQLLFDNLPAATELQVVGSANDALDQLITIGGLAYNPVPAPSAVLGYKDEVLKDSPFMFLRCNEPGGNVALDASGNAHTYRYVAPGAIVFAEPGHLAYDTSTSVLLNSPRVHGGAYISAGYPVANTQASFTLELSFKTPQDNSCIVQFRNFVTQNPCLKCSIAKGGVLTFTFNDGTGEHTGTLITCNDNKWHVLTITQDVVAKIITVYLDGLPYYSLQGVTLGTFANNVIVVGDTVSLSSLYCFYGHVADISYHSVALSNQRVTERFNSTLLDGSQISTVMVPLASRYSLLGRCELAYAGITADKIDDSLLVGSVGNIELRGTELQKRVALYNWTCDDLAAKLNTWRNPRKLYHGGFGAGLGQGRVGY